MSLQDFKVILVNSYSLCLLAWRNRKDILYLHHGCNAQDLLGAAKIPCKNDLEEKEKELQLLTVNAIKKKIYSLTFVIF